MAVEHWRQIASRIKGLMAIAELHGRLGADPYGRGKTLAREAEAIVGELEELARTFANSLPAAAVDRLREAVERCSELLRDAAGGPAARAERVWASLIQLGTLESAITYLLADMQESVRARCERAFAHLQRLLVVNRMVAEEWERAFKVGETECEKLGAVQLLAHGIWAFKVNAEGARTDLVFQEPVEDLAVEERYVDGFVLTEWKKADSAQDAARQFEAARDQARRYAAGALGGSELRRVRYCVVVTKQDVDVPPDATVDQVVYRNINIALAPRKPSAKRPRVEEAEQPQFVEAKAARHE